MSPEQFFRLTGYQFKQQNLLDQALTHRSFARTVNNERLEFLGDSVLSVIISNYIFNRFSSASEGKLSRIRASLVKEATLAQIAGEINLGDHLKLGGGELKSGGFRRPSILADGLEAIIGAIYLDAGFDATEPVVLSLYQNQFESLDGAAVGLKDPKTRLQEHLQGKQMELAEYQVETISGKAHKQMFTVSCHASGIGLSGQGSGSSRKIAEQCAAQELLDQLNQ